MDVFERIEPRLEAVRPTKSKNMLRIMRNATRIAMTPLLVDGETMADLPIVEPLGRHAKPGLFGKLTHTYGAQRLVERCLASGD